MYNYFEGRLDELTPAYAVVDCGGVGYMMEISLSCYESVKDYVKENGEKVRLYVHEAIREDAHLLYGFFYQSERDMFRLLIGVNGIGASSARMILSSMTVEELQQAILNKDAKLLQRVKGIGAKSAQRIVLELQDKIDGVSTGDQPVASSQNVEEAMAALVMLGFAKPAVVKVMQKITKEESGLSVEELIKRGLNLL